MDDSSDTAQPLYKLIKPSLHPASLAKGQSRSENDSAERRRIGRVQKHTTPAVV